MSERKTEEPEAVSGGAARLAPHELLLGQRLRAHVRARFLVAGAVLAAGLAGRYGAGLAGLDVAGLAAVAGAIAAYNAGLLRLIGDAKDPGEAVRLLARRRRLLHASILLDYGALTVCLWFVGGVRSPFVAFYLFHIVIASILLSRRAALLSAVLASALLSGLAALELSGLGVPRMPEGSIPGGDTLDARFVVTLLSVYSVLFTLAAHSQAGLASALRRAERATMEKSAALERTGELRRNFLHVAIHDVSSPLAAVGMLLANLREGLCGPLTPEQAAQTERALRRLERVQGLLGDLRLLGELENVNLRGQGEVVDVSSLLSEVVADHTEEARDRGLVLRSESEPGLPVLGVARLLRTAVTNYVGNAIKYTPPGGRVIVRGVVRGGNVRVEVSDTGIGVAPEDRGKLFREFVRLERHGAGAQGVRGSGLGLSIVRGIVLAHGGSVGMEGAEGGGSTFWLELPRS